MGCIEIGSSPRFHLISDCQQDITRHSTSPITQCTRFNSLFSNELVEERFSNLLDEIEVYFHAISTVTRPIVDTESASLHIRYQLLSLIDHSSVEDQLSITQQAICFGALLFIKTTLPKAPIRGISYTVMLAGLQRYISTIQITNSSTAALLVWLSFLGGISCESSMEKSWFIVRLLNAAGLVGLSTWEDAKLLLSGYWWIESFHELPCKELWEKAMKMNLKDASP